MMAILKDKKKEEDEDVIVVKVITCVNESLY